MELNEMEKKLLFQVEGDYQTKILNELYMTVRYSNNSEQREAAEGLMAKLRVLSNAECMDLVKDIQKNYRLPYPARTIGEKIAEARQQSGAEKLKGHDIMALERFDPEVKHMIVFDVLSYDSPVGDKGDKMRLFLTDAGYQKFLESQERGEVKLKNHAKVSDGHLHYDRRDHVMEIFTAFAAKPEESGSKTSPWQLSWKDDGAYTTWLTAMKERSAVESDVTVTCSDKVLTLSTCTPGGTGRFLVMGKLVKVDNEI